jgi:hypothetical protein
MFGMLKPELRGRIIFSFLGLCINGVSKRSDFTMEFMLFV